MSDISRETSKAVKEHDEDQEFRKGGNAEKGLRHAIAHKEFSKAGDKALAMGEQRVELTEEDVRLFCHLVPFVDLPASLVTPSLTRFHISQSRRICRKTDLNVLTLLCWVYFLQILDKVRHPPLPSSSSSRR